MPTKALTDKFVAGARVSTRTVYFDAKTRGLALRVAPSGTKTWAFTYRTKGQPTQWLRLGDTDGVSLAEARKLAGGHRHAIDVEGRDPAAEQRAAATAPPEPPPAAVFTIGDLCDLYERWAPGRKRSWAKDVEKLTKYIRPAWATRPVRSITRSHVHELLDTVAARGLTVGVNRLQALVSRLFTLALDRGLVDAHPAARMIKRFNETPRTRVLSDDELRALDAGLADQPGPAADVIRLRLLLGQRGGEVASMRWGDVDHEAGVWSIPGAMTKNGRPHMVPLGTQARALLTQRRADGPQDEPRVFPGMDSNDVGFRALSTIPAGAYVWKDLRRTVSTRLAGLGYDETTIGRVLNHARVTVTARHYNQHPYLGEMRQALDAWDRELARIIANEPKKGADVVALAAKGRR